MFYCKQEAAVLKCFSSHNNFHLKPPLVQLGWISTEQEGGRGAGPAQLRWGRPGSDLSQGLTSEDQRTPVPRAQGLPGGTRGARRRGDRDSSPTQLELGGCLGAGSPSCRRYPGPPPCGVTWREGGVVAILGWSGAGRGRGRECEGSWQLAAPGEAASRRMTAFGCDALPAGRRW